MGSSIIDLSSTLKELKQKPDWFREFWRKEVVFHTDCLVDFKLVKDDTRFAGGSAWFCRHCGKPVFCYEHYFEEHDYFAVVKLFCHLGCHSSWKMQEVDPLIATLADSIDFSMFEETDAGLVLRAGTVIRRYYLFDDANQTEPNIIEFTEKGA